MTIPKRPIGLLGGTFDPIHRGHTKIAKDLIEALNLQSMHFIPNKNPVHRHNIVASPEHRLAMVRIATAKNPRFIVNDVEMQRSGPTYTIDTITQIRESIPNQPLCFILGADVFADMNTWQQWQQIPELVHLVIINRPNTTLTRTDWIKTLLEEREVTDVHILQLHPGGHIFQHQIEPMSISATQIRNKLKNKKDVLSELDSDVLRYIHNNNLYL